jgi:GT2 family glycosyltransferase
VAKAESLPADLPSSAASLMRVHVIILNYRTAGLTVDCLKSLAAEVTAHPDWRVVVVDNASGDGSVQIIDQAIEENDWSAWARTLPLTRNLGFAGGNNAAIREALGETSPPDYMLLLNSDTIVRPGAIAILADHLQNNPRVGIAGSQLEDEHGERVSSARRSPGVLSELNDGARLGLLTRALDRWVVSMPLVQEPLRCDWVPGAAMMIRRAVFEQIGLLDEGYFLYYEELDFCDRARKSGWEIWHVPESRVMHLEGAATGIFKPKVRRPQYWYDSRRRYFLRQHGFVQLIAADAAWAIGRLSLLLRKALRLGGRTDNDPRRFMRDLIGGDLRAILSGECCAMTRQAESS